MSVKLEVEEKEEDWFSDDWGTRAIQQKIVRSMIKTEDDSLLEYPKNMEGAYVIVNQDEKNSWGSPPWRTSGHFRKNFYLTHCSSA
jgi:primary-amine oxidase